MEGDQEGGVTPGAGAPLRQCALFLQLFSKASNCP